MEAVAQNAMGMGSICFSERGQSNKEVGGWGIAATAAARAEPGERAQGRAPV